MPVNFNGRVRFARAADCWRSGATSPWVGDGARSASLAHWQSRKQKSNTANGIMIMSRMAEVHSPLNVCWYHPVVRTLNTSPPLWNWDVPQEKTERSQTTSLVLHQRSLRPRVERSLVVGPVARGFGSCVGLGGSGRVQILARRRTVTKGRWSILFSGDRKV